MAEDRFEVRAVARHIQMTPRKERLVVDAVRGKGAREALDRIGFKLFLTTTLNQGHL